MHNIATQLSLIQERIEKACIASNRAPSSVNLLAVSKMQTSEQIQEAFLAGQRDFGENYLQEALEKIDQLKSIRSDIRWHLIGPLQSNKTKPAAENFDWIQSVDRLKIAQRLSDQRPETLPPLNICVQVNISEESSKSGAPKAEALDLCKAIASLPKLRLRGLMAIPEPGTGDQPHRHMHELFIKIQSSLKASGLGEEFDTLSLGMSDDLELAIAQGSTMVRIGTAIFGARKASH